MSDAVFCDPSRLPIIEATGPISVTASRDRFIVTFTQVSPKIDGARPGRSACDVEMIVIARLSFTKKSLDAMLNTISGFKLAESPAVGRG